MVLMMSWAETILGYHNIILGIIKFVNNNFRRRIFYAVR